MKAHLLGQFQGVFARISAYAPQTIFIATYSRRRGGVCPHDKRMKAFVLDHQPNNAGGTGRQKAHRRDQPSQLVSTLTIIELVSVRLRTRDTTLLVPYPGLSAT